MHVLLFRLVSTPVSNMSIVFSYASDVISNVEANISGLSTVFLTTCNT